MLEQMGVDVGVLILHNVVNHQVNWSNLIVSESNINWWLALFVLVEDWEFIIKVLFVIFT